MKVVIFGGREFNNYNLLKEVIESTEAFKEGKITHVISGMARGADTLGARWAHAQGIQVIEMPADWSCYGRSAGPIRNKEMAKIADYGIGFWKGPESKGTTNMINTCKKLNVPLLVYNTETKEILTY